MGKIVLDIFYLAALGAHTWSRRLVRKFNEQISNIILKINWVAFFFLSFLIYSLFDIREFAAQLENTNRENFLCCLCLHFSWIHLSRDSENV